MAWEEVTRKNAVAHARRSARPATKFLSVPLFLAVRGEISSNEAFPRIVRRRRRRRRRRMLTMPSNLFHIAPEYGRSRTVLARSPAYLI